jgi:EmrB/QacA subfamily drug resistance transporter
VDRKWWTLVGACSGLFLLMLDSTIVALALSSIRGDVDASSEGLQWVMNGYLLVIAVLVVTAGRLGDIFGRKRVFIVGIVLFAAGSVLSGAAQDQQMLILGRVVQGIAAAPMLALSLAIVANVFPAEEQPRALGIWAAVSAVALAVGPLVGGLLIEVDWRMIFWINVPIAALGIAITALAAPESTDPSSENRVDWPGLAALSAGLTAVVLALIQSSAWTGPVVIALALAGAIALAGFWLIEHRVPAPIVDFELFRNRPYFGASATAFCLVGAYWVTMFYQPQYLQDVRGDTAILAGILILPVTVPMIFVSPFSGPLIARFGSRALMTAGMALGATGLLILTQLSTSTSYAWLMIGYLLFGIALGCVYAPMSTAAMAAMPGEKVGIASGVLAMVRVMAGSVALAGTSAVFHALREGGDSFTAAIAGSTWVTFGLVALGTALAWIFVSDVKPRDRNRPV